MKTIKRVVIIGSINIDHVYRVPAVPCPGQSLPVTRYERHLGGKGMNQAWAMWQAGFKQVEMHALIGSDAPWILDQLGDFPTDHVRVTPNATGQVVIMIAEGQQGEVASVYDFAANLHWSGEDFEQITRRLGEGDLLVLQNEINRVEDLISLAHARGIRIVWNPAPALSPCLAAYSQVDYLILNEGEANELSRMVSVPIEDLCPNVIVTLGAKGLRAHLHGQDYEMPTPIQVEAIDTVGAGDCFLGYLVAGWCKGMSDREAMNWAMRAAAITCTRPGAFAAIPKANEL